MKKISILCAISLFALTQVVSAQTHTQFITFDDNVGTGNAGTYNSTDSFAVDLYLTFSGYNAGGLSLWLETTADAAPYIFLTAFTYGTTFSDPIQPGALPVGFTLLQSTGLYTTPNPSDLGAITEKPGQVVGPGTYFVGHLSVSLSGLAPGIYALQTDATGPHTSEVTSYDGTNVADENLPVSAYTITIVPEPSTFALLALGAVGTGAWICRRRASWGARF